MPTLTISLPSDLKAFVDDQVAGGEYRKADEYLSSLVRNARKKKAEETLLRLVEEAERSGPATPMTTEDWQNIRRKGLKRLAAEKARNDKARKKARS